MVTHGNRFLLHLIFRESGEEIYTSDEAIKEENLIEKGHSLFNRNKLPRPISFNFETYAKIL